MFVISLQTSPEQSTGSQFHPTQQRYPSRDRPWTWAPSGRPECDNWSVWIDPSRSWTLILFASPYSILDSRVKAPSFGWRPWPSYHAQCTNGTCNEGVTTLTFLSTEHPTWHSSTNQHTSEWCICLLGQMGSFVLHSTHPILALFANPKAFCMKFGCQDPIYYPYKDIFIKFIILNISFPLEFEWVSTIFGV